MIACLQLAPWAATIEQKNSPPLRSQPLLLTLGRAVYGSCALAASAGVQIGMTAQSALGLCPDARIAEAQPPLYGALAEEWTATLAQFGDRLEVKNDPQRLVSFIELPPLRESEAVEMVREMGRALRDQLMLTPAAGLANGKFPAHVAASASRSGFAKVAHTTTAAALLAVRPIETLPCPPEMARRLHLLGIHTVGQFAALPAGAIFAQWGRVGRDLHRLANGRDEQPVAHYVAPPMIEVAASWHDSVEQWEPLVAQLRLLIADLVARLTAERKAAQRITLLLTLEDGSARQREWAQVEAMDAATLERGLTPLLRQCWFHCGVVGIALRAEALVPRFGGARQLSFFVEGGQQARQFATLFPYLRNQYGTDRFWAVALDEGAARVAEQARFQAWRG